MSSPFAQLMTSGLKPIDGIGEFLRFDFYRVDLQGVPDRCAT